MKMKFNSSIRVVCLSIGGAVCAGAVLLIASGAQAQNLFVANYASGTIDEFTPGGAQSTFGSGLSFDFFAISGLAFNSAGDVFVSNQGNGDIIEITPGGAESTFASGLSYPDGLAFQGETLPVPEPSTLGLLAVGVTALLVRRRNLAA
jgi:DNA-binding beta-propeller fold protein YncE